MKLELMLRRVFGRTNNIGDNAKVHFPMHEESFDGKSHVTQLEQSEKYQGHHRFGLQMNSLSREKWKEAKDTGHCKPIICQWKRCMEEFDSDWSLIQHVHHVHLKEQQQQNDYICHWRNCTRSGRCFDARYKLVTHIRTHTKEKLFHCNICGKTFARREALKIHFRSHTGERPYQCTYLGCQKSFKNSSDRHKHVKTHKERQPYKCRFPGCQKQYTDPSTLRKHKKRHAVIPPKEVNSSDVSGRNKVQSVNFFLQYVNMAF